MKKFRPPAITSAPGGPTLRDRAETARDIDMYSHRMIGETIVTDSGKTFRCDRVAATNTPGRVVAFDDNAGKVLKLRSAGDSEEVERHARLLDRLRPGISVDFPAKPVVLPGSHVALDGLITDHAPEFRAGDVLSHISLEFVSRTYVETIVRAYHLFLLWLISEKRLFPTYGFHAPAADICSGEAHQEFKRFFDNLLYSPDTKTVSVVSVGGLVELPSSGVKAALSQVPAMVDDLRRFMYCKRRRAGEILELDYDPGAVSSSVVPEPPVSAEDEDMYRSW